MPAAWNERKSLLLFGVLVFFHLGLISIQIPRGGGPTLLARAVFAVAAPVQKAGAAVGRGIADGWRGWADLRGARVENQALKREAFFLRQENRFLRDALGAFQSEAVLRRNLEAFRSSLVPARVIGADEGNIFKSVIIDRGARDGLRPGLAVCDKLGRLVGRTVDPVGNGESRVQLITDDESGVSVISEKDRLVGVLSGDAAAGRCRLKYIVVTAPGGTEGDLLLTTGFDGIYPAGIPVGRIVSISGGGGLFKTIVVEPLFRLEELDVVGVIAARDGSR
jgi:rod shape-determining protein MreC